MQLELTLHCEVCGEKVPLEHDDGSVCLKNPKAHVDCHGEATRVVVYIENDRVGSFENEGFEINISSE